MKNVQAWQETKFVLRGGELRGNTDTRYVGIGSRLNVELLAKSLHGALNRYANGRLADLGCGNVPLFAAYRELVSDVTCVDWPNTEHESTHLDLAADLTESLPFDGASFDTVLLSDVLEHIPKPQLLLSETFRILRPGGYLILSVPFLYVLHEEPHDHFRYTSHQLRRLATDCRFEVSELEVYGLGTDVVFDLCAKLIHGVHWRFGPKLASGACSLGLKLRYSRLGMKLNRGMSSMPLGYVAVLKKTA